MSTTATATATTTTTTTGVTTTSKHHRVAFDKSAITEKGIKNNSAYGGPSSPSRPLEPKGTKRISRWNEKAEEQPCDSNSTANSNDTPTRPLPLQQPHGKSFFDFVAGEDDKTQAAQGKGMKMKKKRSGATNTLLDLVQKQQRACRRCEKGAEVEEGSPFLDSSNSSSCSNLVSSGGGRRRRCSLQQLLIEGAKRQFGRVKVMETAVAVSPGKPPRPPSPSTTKGRTLVYFDVGVNQTNIGKVYFEVRLSCREQLGIEGF